MKEWQTLLELGHERLLSKDELEDGVPFSEFFDEFDEQTEPAAGSEGDDDDAGPLVPPSWAHNLRCLLSSKSNMCERCCCRKL
jgi:hypothetical protein